MKDAPLVHPHSDFFATLSAPFATPCWKKTAPGSPIALFASAEPSTLGAGDSRPIVLLGGVHGDEPEGVELACRAIEWLGRQDPARLVPWIAVPCLNVDGFALRTRVNGRGVDLNRNYPTKDWSPHCEKPRYFPGGAPASEPEVQLVVELVDLVKPKLLIHCHSWEPCVVFTGEPGRAAANQLALASGYEAKDDIGYPTPGSLSGFGWRERGIPVICIEERDGLSDLSAVWPRFAPAFAEIFALDLKTNTPGRSQP